jgi:hypothetical protein
MQSDPLAEPDDLTTADKIALSTGGCVCLIAYWIFSSTIFDADQPVPEMHIFPEHFNALDKFLQDDAHAQIQKSLGTIDSLVAIGLWLQSNNHVSPNPTSPLTNPTTSPEDPTSDFMRYIHLTTLMALYHPRIQVRNAASALAGLVLHADPSDDDRLRILYDLLENCMFASLKALAVVWLREEFLLASSSTSTTGTSAGAKQCGLALNNTEGQGQGHSNHHNPNLFTTPQPLEMLQYVIFPPLGFLADAETALADQVEYLSANAAFLLQAVNFGLFLWGGHGSDGHSNAWAAVIPANLEATVRERWFDPLRETVEKVEREGRGGGGGVEGEKTELGPLGGELAVLRERLACLDECPGFKVKG